MNTEQDKLITPSRVPVNDYPMSSGFMPRRFHERWKSGLQAASAYEKLTTHPIYVRRTAIFQWILFRISTGCT